MKYETKGKVYKIQFSVFIYNILMILIRDNFTDFNDKQILTKYY